MYLQTLGRIEFIGATLSRPKVLSMLAYLSLEGSKDRGHLGDLFFMGVSDPRSSLRISLKHIRDIADGVINNDRDFVAVEVPSDAAELLTSIEAQDYERTIALYKGAFLEGFRIKGASVELEEWIFETREYLALGVRRAMLELSTQLAQEGSFVEAANLAAKAFKLAGAPEPEPEQFRQLYALMLAGDSIEALELKKLANEYGFELDITREEAKAQFYKEAPATPKPTGTETEAVTSETAIPEQIQTAVAQKPTNMRPRNNLFIGRSKELQEITSLLGEPDHRLVTLHGQGGIGKTRLVTHTGLELLERPEFADGIYFVALESLSDGSQIIPAIANSLGVILATDVDPIDALAAQIGSKNMLIIMDNFEHVIDSAIICSDILKRCRSLKLLVSSREGMNLAGEIIYEVKGFSAPSSEQLSLELALEYDIIQLFIDRARHASLSYKLTEEQLPYVIKICQLVEGLPLAVELAAAGLRYMPMFEIVEAIEEDLDMLYMPARDKAERHHSLRATFEYSWKLLAPKEQQVLVHLAVFRGGFSRTAANAVAGASLPILRSLVDKALIRVLPDSRFSRHMLLYQFTVEKFLQDPERATIQEKHANYFMQYSEEAEPQLIAEKQVEWLSKLEAEHENMRIALQWNLENDIDAALRQSAALRRFWEIRGYFVEGQDWYTKILNSVFAKDTEAYLKTLYAASALLRVQQEVDTAKDYLQECKKLANKLDQPQLLADTINQLAGISWGEGDFVTAHDLLEQSLEIKRNLNDKRGIAIALNNLGLLAISQKNPVLAKTLYTESLGIYKKLEDKKQVIGSLRAIGNVYDKTYDFVIAKEYFDEALILAIELEDKFQESQLYNDIGCVFCFENRFEEAKELFQKGKIIAKNNSLDLILIRNNLSLAALEYVEGEISNSFYSYKESLLHAITKNYKTLIANAFEGIAHINLKQNNVEDAAVLLGASHKLVGGEVLRIQHYFPSYYQESAILENLGEQGFQTCFTKGKKLAMPELLLLVEKSFLAIKT